MGLESIGRGESLRAGGQVGMVWQSSAGGFCTGTAYSLL